MFQLNIVNPNHKAETLVILESLLGGSDERRDRGSFEYEIEMMTERGLVIFFADSDVRELVVEKEDELRRIFGQKAQVCIIDNYFRRWDQTIQEK